MNLCHVLVTRPDGQQQALVDWLEQDGFQVSHQPALVIEPLVGTDATLDCLRHIQRYEIAVLTSPNVAVLLLEALAEVSRDVLAGVTWLAVGEATAQVLRNAGLHVECPEQGFDSEALLALSPLERVRGRRVLLVRGEGGRGLLAPTLQERGALLDEAVLYRRVCNGAFRWPARPVQVLMITSLQGWECIVAQVPDECRVIAGSARIAARIAADGFQVSTADSPHDDDMRAALHAWCAENR